MSSVDIAIAGVLLSAAVILFIFNVQPEASDSAPHRTKLDQLMERRDAIYENAFITSTRFFLLQKINFRVFAKTSCADRSRGALPQLAWISRRNKL